MEASEFFQHPQVAAHKQYEALRAFYVEGKSAAEVAQKFGYTLTCGVWIEGWAFLRDLMSCRKRLGFLTMLIG